jgi:hypothetical protein
MDTDDLALAHTTAKLGSTGTDPQVTKKNNDYPSSVIQWRTTIAFIIIQSSSPHTLAAL